MCECISLYPLHIATPTTGSRGNTGDSNTAGVIGETPTPSTATIVTSTVLSCTLASLCCVRVYLTVHVCVSAHPSILSVVSRTTESSGNTSDSNTDEVIGGIIAVFILLLLFISIIAVALGYMYWRSTNEKPDDVELGDTGTHSQKRRSTLLCTWKRKYQDTVVITGNLYTPPPQPVTPPSPSSPPLAKVLLIYSQNSPLDEIETVVKFLVFDLRYHGIKVAYPGECRGNIARWVEDKYTDADKILYVCNKAFSCEFKENGSHGITFVSALRGLVYTDHTEVTHRLVWGVFDLKVVHVAFHAHTENTSMLMWVHMKSLQDSSQVCLQDTGADPVLENRWG